MIAAPQGPGWWPDWSLFGDALGTGLLLGALLPWCGVLLVLRQQVFVAAAIGQAANGGIALAMAAASWSGLGHLHAGGTPWWLPAGAVAAVLAAIAALRQPPHTAGLEARSAFLFLAGGAGAVLLLASQPHGQQELQRLFLSSLLAAGPGDLGFAAGALVVAAVGLAARRRLLLAWALDPWTARAHGVPVVRLDWLGGLWLGLVLAHGIAATGLLFTFGAAVLPVLAMRAAARSLRAVVLGAPLLGAAGSAVGFAVAHRLDLPPGQVAVAVLAAVAVVLRAVGSRGGAG